jgi:hypothetical protein
MAPPFAGDARAPAAVLMTGVKLPRFWGAVYHTCSAICWCSLWCSLWALRAAMGLLLAYATVK